MNKKRGTGSHTSKGFEVVMGPFRNRDCRTATRRSGHETAHLVTCSKEAHL